jgi:carboxyl-terminal processing protease
MNKSLRIVLIVFSVLAIVACSFGGGVVTGRFLPNTKASAATSNGTPSSEQAIFAPFWQAWDIVHSQYVDQPVDDTKLMQGAITGMINSLGDAHSNYWTQQEFKDNTSFLQGQYAGIGAYVDTSSKLLTVTKPIAGSPAEKAGLLKGDQIIKIDGNDVTALDPESVRQKVLGEPGTTVTLTIQRPGQDQPFDVKIVRATIVVPSVTSKMLDNNIAYIQIVDFGQSTGQDFHDQLKTLLANNPKGIILDLRDNGGGYLDTAISVASEFLPSGVVVYEQSGDGTKKPYNVTSGGLATGNIPLVVLVNGYSASASEIVSGALQDTGRGKLIGEKTYGKGTVQLVIPLDNNQGAVHITVARWLTPDGRQIDKKGLNPDIAATLTADDVKAGRDPQMDAAIKAIDPNAVPAATNAATSIPTTVPATATP